MDSWIDLAGWLGMSLVLAAFAWTTFQPRVAGSARIGWLNLAGSCGLVANSFYNGAYPVAALNAAWAAIAALALVRARGRGPLGRASR